VLKEQHPDDQEVQALLASVEEEIAVFRTHSREYGYTFFIVKNGDDPEQQH